MVKDVPKTFRSNFLVSVVIPTYNRARPLADAIDSVLAQTYRPIEVIVVDDGSTDETSSVVKGYEDAVRYIRQENGGAGRARNTGIRASRGELTAFLDSDDMWLPEKLELQVAVMQRDPTVGAVDCSLYWLESDGVTVLPIIRGRECEGVAFERLIVRNRCTSSSIMVRAECFREVGLFDENLSGAADWDMWLRLARRYRIAWVTTPLVQIRDVGGGLHADVAHMIQDRQRLLRKHLTGDVPFPLRRRVLALSHTQTGFGHLEGGDRLQGALAMLRALVYSPADRRAVGGLLRAILGQRLFKWITRVWRKRGQATAKALPRWDKDAEVYRWQFQGVVYAEALSLEGQRRR